MPDSDLPTRTWGDGVGDKRPHVIEDISYGEPSWIACRCGERISAEFPGLLAGKWRAHGGKVLSGSFADRGEPVIVKDDERRAIEAWLALQDMSEQCTCSVTPVTKCPNYLPGDEIEEAYD